MSRATAALGRLLGSTTILGAILFYFGWSRAYYFYDYLGVDSSLLGLTTGDYVQMSVDGVFVPVLLSGSGLLAAAYAFGHLRDRPALRSLMARPAFGVARDLTGLLLLANGLSRIYVVTPPNRPLAAAPASIALGFALVLAGLWRRRGTPAVTVVVLAMAVGAVCLFWIANDYSAAVGRARARQYVAELPSQPNAVVLSTSRLRLAGEGVEEEVCAGDETGYRYRYTGLKLVLRSGDGLLFLPAEWSRRTGVAIFLRNGDDLRLELSPPGAVVLRADC